MRFLPQIIVALNSVDPEDPLIAMLEEILTQFHYSGIGYDLDLKNVNWQEELKDKTYRKLYLERIVEKKDYKLAEIPFINKLITAEFGIHKDAFYLGAEVSLTINAAWLPRLALPTKAQCGWVPSLQ